MSQSSDVWMLPKLKVIDEMILTLSLSQQPQKAFVNFKFLYSFFPNKSFAPTTYDLGFTLTKQIQKGDVEWWAHKDFVLNLSLFFISNGVCIYVAMQSIA